MSLAEEMLNDVSLLNATSRIATEDEPHIVINESRQIIVPSELRTLAVMGDTGVETVTFDCVRYWDGNDLSTFAIYLNYVLPNGERKSYVPKAIRVAEGEDVFHFDWEIKNIMTQTSGGISFSVAAIKTKEVDGRTIVDKRWSSLINSECTIANCVQITNVPSDVEDASILAQMSKTLADLQSTQIEIGNALDIIIGIQDTLTGIPTDGGDVGGGSGGSGGDDIVHGDLIDPDELLYEFVGETEHGSHTESYDYNWDEDDNRTSVNLSYSHDGAGAVTDQPFGFVISSTEDHAFGNVYRKLRVVIESYECPTPTPSINGKFFRDYSVGDSFVVEGVYREDDEFSYYDYFIDLYNVAHAATHFYCTLRFETVEE